MRFLKYIFVGFILGVTLYKAEAVSWFRIFEMFHFQSFHMFGIIGSAVVAGIIIVQIIKAKQLKSIDGDKIIIRAKDKSISRYLLGGIIFGLGWALAGICPGPLFILIGSGHTVLVLFLFAALAGTILYGMIQQKLPH